MARLAQAHEFVERLPQGYDTVIGERGITLSGGQRQRIAIARALAVDPRILILDDATASVDATTEAHIRAGLREVMSGRTTLIIAHRLSTIALADEIVVLDDGRIAARGTHEELLETSAVYREIYEHGLLERQFADAVEARAEVEEVASARPPARRHHRAAHGRGRRRLVVEHDATAARRPLAADASRTASAPSSRSSPSWPRRRPRSRLRSSRSTRSTTRSTHTTGTKLVVVVVLFVVARRSRTGA